MVVLVRCLDDTFAPALESRLNELIGKGLISAFLKNETWVRVEQKQEKLEPSAAKRTTLKIPRLAVGF